MSGRHVVNGALGCPECGAEYVIENGEAHLGAAVGVGEPGAAQPELEDVAWHDDAEAALRLAALLALSDVRHPVLLTGRWAALGDELAVLAPALYLAINPEQRIPPDRSELSVIRAVDSLHLAAGKLHAAAVDASAVRAGLLSGAASAVRAGGRLIAPASAPLPPHYAELARDATMWIAEQQQVYTGSPLSRARPSGVG